MASHAPDRRLGTSVVAALAVAALLHTLGQLLQVPSNYGIEDLLGWTDPARGAQMLSLWQAKLGPWWRWLAGAYLGLDTAVFMPLYGLSFVGLWWQLQRDYADHSARPPEWGGWLVRVGFGLVLALWAVDLTENLAGLSNLGLESGFLPTALGLGVVLGLLWRSLDRRWLGALLDAVGLRPFHARRILTCVAVAVVAATVGRADCQGEWALMCEAHRMKSCLILGLLAGPLLLVLWIQYGPHANPGQWPRIVALRGGLVGLLWRTRYVLGALAGCCALLLVMNQGQDVLFSMASHEAGPALFVSLVLTALALWVLGHSCWLWARLAMRVRPRSLPPLSGDGLPRTEDRLAQLWARLLGITPALLVLGMVQAVLPHAVALRAAPDLVLIVSLLLLFAAAVLLMAIGFIWSRERQSSGSVGIDQCYYASHPLEQVLAMSNRRRLFGLIPATALPATALALGLFCRCLSLVDGMPTLTLPVVLCMVAFWLGVAGWISLYEESEAVPWFVFGLLVTGLLGSIGWTENHRMPVAPTGASLSADTALLATLALGLLWGAGSLLLTRLMLGAPTMRRVAALVLAWLAANFIILHGADRWLRHEPALQVPVQKTAPVALAEWLRSLPKSQDRLPVYVVAAEGGGIRSAYWTALALERLAASQAHFEQRTWAMTGVSGGAVGLAVYRACRLQHAADAAALRECLDRFGSADLLGPLASAWFFEDAIARWIPVKGCQEPGCGFMSRGLWFEGAMNAAVPGLRKGLVSSRLDQRSAGHLPYLFLNSTWVESGERTLASDLKIEPEWFPGARDELRIVGHDLPLSTAAHNAARFPFTNALGSVCSPDGQRQPPVSGAASDNSPLCGHLADGGYFDNPAGHTAADLLGLLSHCLGDLRDDSPFCPQLDRAARQALQARLQPRMILIRNGVELGPMPSKACPPQTGLPPVPDDLTLSGVPQPQEPRGLRQPQCASNGRLFIDALGPAWTALNTIGIGANGRLAVTRAGQYEDAEVVLADLRADGPLYPLGWHLSAASRREMRRQATELDANALLR